MRHVLTVLLPIFLIGCSVMVGEPERKVRVQALINQLADESLENRQAAYAELRDTFVRKRDIPELTKEIARNANPEVTMSLQNLITFIEGRWRLPDKGWTTDIGECWRCYEKEFQDLGCDLAIVSHEGGIGEYLLTLNVDVLDVPIENKTGVINLILTLEPESLKIWNAWSNITFLDTLENLKKLNLENTKVIDLTPLKGLPRLRDLELGDTKVTDLKPLKGLPNLAYLGLQNTGVTDLTPLKGMPKLRSLGLRDTKVADLTPLKGLPKLYGLSLGNTKVTDLTPLKGLPNLAYLGLQNTGVTDLTPLKGLPKLDRLELQSTGVTDLTPLKGMPRLRYLHLENTKVTDLTPLKGMPDLQIFEK